MRIWEGAPWSFDKNLIVLKAYEGNVPANKILFDKCDFWVQICDLPLNRMNSDIAKLIGNGMGTFLSVDADENGIAWGEFMLIRVNISVDKPQRRCIKIIFDGEDHFLKGLLVWNWSKKSHWIGNSSRNELTTLDKMISLTWNEELN